MSDGFSGWASRRGEARNLTTPHRTRRALLALRDRPLSRIYLVGVLWPDYLAEHSFADLRTALWRANHARAPVITITRMCLAIFSETTLAS